MKNSSLPDFNILSEYKLGLFMVSALLFPRETLFVKRTNPLYRSFAVYVLFILICFLGSPAYSAFTCTDGSTPIKTNCIMGRCGLCPLSTESWANPSAEVIFQGGVYECSICVDTGVPIYRSIINASECAVFGGIAARICLRVAKPRVPAQNGYPAVSGDMGNTNGESPMLCAYEDPWDMWDSNLGRSPYHQGRNNLTVTQAIGCINRQIGPVPPVWSNNAWFNNSAPIPTFVEDAGQEKIANAPYSVFESPRIKMKVCEDRSHNIVSCQSSGVNAVDITEIVPSAVLNPRSSNNYKECAPDSFSRTFCAEITTREPDKVIVSMLSNTSSTWEQVASFNRPGYIPKPTVTEATGSTTTAPIIDVTLRGKTVTLKGDPGIFAATNPAPTPNWVRSDSCKYLHQVEFCISRPCKPGTLQINTTVVSGVSVPTSTSCTYEDMICASGYSTGPLVVANKISTTTMADNTADKVIAGFPNVQKTANIAINNNNSAAYFEQRSTLTTPGALQETFKRDIWIFKPDKPTCNRMSSSTTGVGAYCQNYYSTCVGGGSPPCTEYAVENASAAADAWYVDDRTQVVRAMNEFEAGLCLYTPPDTQVKTYPNAGCTVGTTCTYTVPKHCTQIQVKVWGGGAAAINEIGGNRDASGGAGGYATATLNVTQDQVFSFSVGGGGRTLGASGGQSWFNTSGYLFANGGSNPSGGGYGGTAPGRTGQNGGSGEDVNGGYQLKDGGAAFGYTGQSGEMCRITITSSSPAQSPTGITNTIVGAGGCGTDDTPSCCGYGTWGYGGNGQVTIQCTQGMN